MDFNLAIWQKLATQFGIQLELVSNLKDYESRSLSFDCYRTAGVLGILILNAINFTRNRKKSNITIEYDIV